MRFSLYCGYVFLCGLFLYALRCPFYCGSNGIYGVDLKCIMLLNHRFRVCGHLVTLGMVPVLEGLVWNLAQLVTGFVNDTVCY